MTHLSVNVNKLATLRNSRDKNLPDVTLLAAKILDFGAHGITVHPRPDGRHIRWKDVASIDALIRDRNRRLSSQVEFNIEGYPSPEFMNLMAQIQPHQCTLVPDPPEALTSNAGWDLSANEALLKEILERSRTLAPTTRVSLFVDPARFNSAQEAALARLKPNRIELYTEAYSDHFTQSDREQITGTYLKTSLYARSLGIGVNAGHDLNQQNLGYLLAQIPWIDEVSIGHALICEALEQGLETTVHAYLQITRAL